MKTSTGSPITAGLLLGMGLGGFFDGILLHQLLQWHNMLSGWLPVIDLVSAKINMFWGGVFHAAVWGLTLAGVAAAWRVPRLPGAGRRLVGWMLAGWGLFNLVEGAVNHLYLGLHHVREYSLNRAGWDWAFEASGVLLVALGLWMAWGGRRQGLPSD